MKPEYNKICRTLKNIIELNKYCYTSCTMQLRLTNIELKFICRPTVSVTIIYRVPLLIMFSMFSTKKFKHGTSSVVNRINEILQIIAIESPGKAGACKASYNFIANYACQRT